MSLGVLLSSLGVKETLRCATMWPVNSVSSSNGVEANWSKEGLSRLPSAGYDLVAGAKFGA